MEKYSYINQEKTLQFWYLAKANKGEARLMSLVRAALCAENADHVFPDVGYQPDVDRVIFEYSVPHGRADAAIFHMDGSVTMVEAKCGEYGMRHVLSGIGQATMYALALTLKAGSPRVVRKALLWSATNCLEHEVLIYEACLAAGVVPMPYGATDKHMAVINGL